jgi:hypothetical protein
MPLTLIAVIAAVWLALLVVVWALCVAAGRADAGAAVVATVQSPAASSELCSSGQHSVSARVTDTDGGVASLLGRRTSFSPVERSERFARDGNKTSSF